MTRKRVEHRVPYRGPKIPFARASPAAARRGGALRSGRPSPSSQPFARAATSAPGGPLLRRSRSSGRRHRFRPGRAATGLALAYFDPGAFAGVLVVGTARGDLRLVVVDGVELVGVELVGVLDVGVEVVGVLAVGVDVVDGFGAVAVPVAGSVLGGFVIVLTSDVSPETATNAAATPPSPSRKMTVTMMIGTRQLPGRRMRVVAA